MRENCESGQVVVREGRYSDVDENIIIVPVLHESYCFSFITSIFRPASVEIFVH